MSNPLDVQVGGNHYKKMGIQPIEYINANKLGFEEGNVVKYITRHASKNGAEDVKKVKHYCDFILKFQYGVEEKKSELAEFDSLAIEMQTLKQKLTPNYNYIEDMKFCIENMKREIKAREAKQSVRD